MTSQGNYGNYCLLDMIFLLLLLGATSILNLKFLALALLCYGSRVIISVVYRWNVFTKVITIDVNEASRFNIRTTSLHHLFNPNGRIMFSKGIITVPRSNFNLQYRICRYNLQTSFEINFFFCEYSIFI